MADRNGNGIDDSLERKGSLKKPMSAPEGYWATNKNNTYEPSESLTGWGGEFVNFLNDANRNTGNWMSTVFGGVTTPGGGYGDYRVGSTPSAKKPARNVSNPFPKFNKPSVEEEQGPEMDPGMSFADYLAMAAGLMPGPGSISYDPQRGAARSRASEADSRLEAMYRQLRGSIDADAPVLQAAFDDASAAAAATSQGAQDQAQAATDSANARNSEVLANLGIEQAAGNQIINGTDLSSQTADRIGAMAERGQAVGDRLTSNKATALMHNTNIGNAAGLEGNLQRAANQGRLSDLLAEYDMREQQENAALQQSRFGQQLGLAESIIGFDDNRQNRQDRLQMSALEMAQAQREWEAGQQNTYDPNAFWQYIADLTEAGTITNPQELDPRDQIAMYDLLRKQHKG